MKQLHFLTISILLTISYTTHAELVNGFSDIRSQNPIKKKSRLMASDERITEQMGNPVTLEKFADFTLTTSQYLDQLSLLQQNGKKLNEEELKIATKAISDLMRALKKLPEHEQTQALQLMTPVEEQFKQFTPQLGRLKALINDAKSSK